MTILGKILREKEKEVAAWKEQTLANTDKTKGHDLASANQSFSDYRIKNNIPKIADTFRRSENMNIIAEIKRSSPSKGAIDMSVNPVAQAKQYEKFGAGAISVLTDKSFFNGTIEDLQAVREAVDLPLLCKDFIIDRIQIDRAKAAGATIILLIVAALPEDALKNLHDYALEQDLEVLCEVHNEDEMEIALRLGTEIIGINNRDLKTFNVDLAVTEKLASMVDNPETILISESGIKTRDDVACVAEHGASAILVGETLMRSGNLEKAFAELRIPLAAAPR